MGQFVVQALVRGAIEKVALPTSIVASAKAHLKSLKLQDWIPSRGLDLRRRDN